MPELLFNAVCNKTRLKTGYKVYASAQSLEAFLLDWEKADRTLQLRILRLRALLEERKQQEADGTWETVVQVYEKGKSN